MKTQAGILSLLFCLGPFLGMTACAYRLGSGPRSLPGGYTQVSVPVFKNKTQETGIEVGFTKALLSEFLRSNAGQVVDEPKAEVRVEGEIVAVTYRPESPVTPDTSAGRYLPRGTVLASRYRILTDVKLRLVRRSDGDVIWQGDFRGERTYAAPQVHMAGVNSVNPLYNLSARRQNLEVLAQEMMLEAHSRMTENF